MKFYDISQEVFSSSVYPGDSKPERIVKMQTSKGDICNLTALTMCAHNGTHVDAPFHFYGNGKTIDRIPVEKFFGWCFVADFEGTVAKEDAELILQKAERAGEKISKLQTDSYIAEKNETGLCAAKKILIKGKTTISEEAAQVFAEAKIELIGNESQTIGPENAPAKTHYILLKEETVLLEGVRLSHVPEGVYFLSAAPLNLGGADGSPCRAFLIEF